MYVVYRNTVIYGCGVLWCKINDVTTALAGGRCGGSWRCIHPSENSHEFFSEFLNVALFATLRSLRFVPCAQFLVACCDAQFAAVSFSLFCKEKMQLYDGGSRRAKRMCEDRVPANRFSFLLETKSTENHSAEDKAI
jgi:hypothetical protein